MNKILFATIGAAILTACNTELQMLASDLPPAVAAAFNAKYPTAANPEWEAEKEEGRLVFEAEFKLDGKRHEATFRPDGTFVKEDRD